MNYLEEILRVEENNEIHEHNWPPKDEFDDLFFVEIKPYELSMITGGPDNLKYIKD
jgi:hypothetical protein